MISLAELKRSLKVALWFVFLTFPLMVIKADPIERTVNWRWENMAYVGVGSFLVSILLRAFFVQQERRRNRRRIRAIPVTGRVFPPAGRRRSPPGRTSSAGAGTACRGGEGRQLT